LSGWVGVCFICCLIFDIVGGVCGCCDLEFGFVLEWVFVFGWYLFVGFGWFVCVRYCDCELLGFVGGVVVFFWYGMGYCCV